MISLFDRFALFLNVKPRINTFLTMDNPINGDLLKSVLVKQCGKKSITQWSSGALKHI